MTSGRAKQLSTTIAKERSTCFFIQIGGVTFFFPIDDGITAHGLDITTGKIKKALDACQGAIAQVKILAGFPRQVGSIALFRILDNFIPTSRTIIRILGINVIQYKLASRY